MHKLATRHSLPKTRQQILDVIGVVALHESDKETVGTERALEDGLQQTVGGDLDEDGAGRHMLQRLLEEDGTDEVVDVVVGRGVPGQLRVPSVLRDGAAHPARGTYPVLLDHLKHTDTVTEWFTNMTPGGRNQSRNVTPVLTSIELRK